MKRSIFEDVLCILTVIIGFIFMALADSTIVIVLGAVFVNVGFTGRVLFLLIGLIRTIEK